MGCFGWLITGLFALGIITGIFAGCSGEGERVTMDSVYSPKNGTVVYTEDEPDGYVLQEQAQETRETLQAPVKVIQPTEAEEEPSEDISKLDVVRRVKATLDTISDCARAALNVEPALAAASGVGGKIDVLLEFRSQMIFCTAEFVGHIKWFAQPQVFKHLLSIYTAPAEWVLKIEVAMETVEQWVVWVDVKLKGLGY